MTPVAPVPEARASFLATRDYPLDRFQLEALDALDAGRSVLVAAPTGSGKTVVADYAVHLALRSGVKAYYTTPLKALSNQKVLRPAQGSRRSTRSACSRVTTPSTGAPASWS